MGILKIFSYLYDLTISWSAHRHARYYLAAVSFAESSFFPIPPDVMLLSMGLAKPKNAWGYALIATLFSVLGGILGYLIGMLFIELIEPFILSSSFEHHYHVVHQWFETGGVWMVILAGFTPFPYKIFTIAAGAMALSFWPFVIGSIIGRGLRFFLVSSLMYYAGNSIHKHLKYYVDLIGWLSILAVSLFIYYKWT